MTAENGSDEGTTHGSGASTATDSTGVFVADTKAKRDDALAVRQRVFVDEQGVDESIEYDGYDDPDAPATHFVAYNGEDVVGAARIRPVTGKGDAPSRSDDPKTAKVERVAVAADSRGEGWGRQIMESVESWGREAGYTRFVLNAQTHVREFYERLGYKAHGEEFEEAGIPHIAMDKSLRDETS